MDKSMKLYFVIIADLSQIGNFSRALSSETKSVIFDFGTRSDSSPNSNSRREKKSFRANDIFNKCPRMTSFVSFEPLSISGILGIISRSPLNLIYSITDTAQNAITSSVSPQEEETERSSIIAGYLSLRQSWRCTSRSEMNASHPHHGVKSDRDCSARSRNAL